MSEQDKEMEAAAQAHAIKTRGHPDDDRTQVVETTWRALRSGTIIDFAAGWKAASERKDVTQYINRIDQLGQLIRERDNKIQSLQSKLATALEALEFYAQEPIADNGTVWSESCLEWGVQSFTWKPLTDLGERAREALAKIKGEK